MNTADFIRYLTAKKTIDDRSLNAHVWQHFVSQLNESIQPRILELGAGIGTMAQRLIERGVLRHAHYTLLDEQTALMDHARARLSDAPSDVSFEFVAHDARAFLRACAPQSFDALIAHAFIDLFDLSEIVPLMLRALKPGGVFYLTINFDGATIFEPTLDAALDAQIEQAYHATMDERTIGGKPSGDSRSGRHLFAHLQNAGTTILASGSSDWVVFPSRRRYADDDAFFLRCILGFFDESLSQSARLDQNRFMQWLTQRHQQIERGELIYIAHQLDFVGTR
jgi:SAM-dependent methyltransferase